MTTQASAVATLLLLLIMVSSGLWVAFDARRRTRPWGEVIAWGLFATAFLGLGLLLYLLWGRKTA